MIKLPGWINLNLILPGKCMFCDKEMRLGSKSPYCSRCYYNLPMKEHEKRCLLCQRVIYGIGNIKLCHICENNKLYFDVNYAPFSYKGSVEDAIKRFKFCRRMWYGKYFASFMAKELSDKKIKADYIVYPPVNRSTYKKRGYNQSEILAKNLSKILKIPYISKALYKLRENEKQSLQKLETRFSNVRGVFDVSDKAKALIKGKNIIFTDDILTTGATASECSKMLKKAGAKTVISVTVATTE